MFHKPMSSPQITRIFGFWPDACPGPGLFFSCASAEGRTCDEDANQPPIALKATTARATATRWDDETTFMAQLLLSVGHVYPGLEKRRAIGDPSTKDFQRCHTELQQGQA